MQTETIEDHLGVHHSIRWQEASFQTKQEPNDRLAAIWNCSRLSGWDKVLRFSKKKHIHDVLIGSIRKEAHTKCMIETVSATEFLEHLFRCSIKYLQLYLFLFLEGSLWSWNCLASKVRSEAIWSRDDNKEPHLRLGLHQCSHGKEFFPSPSPSP